MRVLPLRCLRRSGVSRYRRPMEIVLSICIAVAVLTLGLVVWVLFISVRARFRRRRLDLQRFGKNP